MAFRFRRHGDYINSVEGTTQFDIIIGLLVVWAYFLYMV